MIYLLAQRRQDLPAKDEVSSVGDTRVILYAVALALTVSALLPTPARFCHTTLLASP